MKRDCCVLWSADRERAELRDNSERRLRFMLAWSPISRVAAPTYLILYVAGIGAR